MHTHLLALSGAGGQLASDGATLFVIILTVLFFLMVFAVLRTPTWQPSIPADGAGQAQARPGGRPVPLPRRAASVAPSVFQPALPERVAAGSVAPAAVAAGSVAPAAVKAPPRPPSAAEPDPPALERPVVTGRPPWGPAPRPPGQI